jgi:alpha-galactosidase/6-phospho-beta-glucosidase family protein
MCAAIAITNAITTTNNPRPNINAKVSGLFIKIKASSIVETTPTVTKKYSMTSPRVDAIFI